MSYLPLDKETSKIFTEENSMLVLKRHSQLKTNKAKCPSENPLGVTLCYETNLSGYRCLKMKNELYNKDDSQC